VQTFIKFQMLSKLGSGSCNVDHFGVSRGRSLHKTRRSACNVLRTHRYIRLLRYCAVFYTAGFSCPSLLVSPSDGADRARRVSIGRNIGRSQFEPVVAERACSPNSTYPVLRGTLAVLSIMLLVHWASLLLSCSSFQQTITASHWANRLAQWTAQKSIIISTAWQPGAPVISCPSEVAKTASLRYAQTRDFDATMTFGRFVLICYPRNDVMHHDTQGGRFVK
jgi:hypothetical protein